MSYPNIETLSRIRGLQSGVIYVDYDDTLCINGNPNIPLINELRDAQKRGISVHLWTHAGFNEANHRADSMIQYGLTFDDVHCNVQKADLIIDNLAVCP